MTEFSCGSGSGGADDARTKAECAEVIAEVWTLLDGECTAETRQKLRRHLEECPGCLRHYGLEERIKALIATKCKGDKAPESLRERLRLEISRTTIIRTRMSGPF
ncbi:mycothiol system anti-sigma-R factor [Mycobacterium sp.]|uniref:mycothiol system anti-sigma-R factor n=1 Tax=Mycobacterium sp. TaxID=1785 RepID=UPI003D6A7BF7